MAKIFKKIVVFICILVFSGVFACNRANNNTSSTSKQTLSSSSVDNSYSSANQDNSSSLNTSSQSSSSFSTEQSSNAISSSSFSTEQSSNATSSSSSSQSSLVSSSSTQAQSSASSQTSSSASSSSSSNNSQGDDEPIIMTNQTETYAEMWRPQYHYSASQSWVNDPNGLVYYKGVWHKYYQTNPNTNVFGNIHWGHATSTDLINWVEHSPVLAPDSVGLMFSGTAVVDHNNTTGFFTNTPDKKGIVLAYSTDTQHIGIAYSLDDGYTFTKYSTTTPVLKNPNEEHFRDPHIFWYEETQEWIMVIAGGFVRYYASKNLIDWTHRSTTNIWTECPNLVKFKVEGTNYYKWLLYCGGRGYYVGNFNGTTFTPETGYIQIDGPDNYAGITYANAPNDRIVMSSWLNSWNYTAPEGKWNGCFTLPIEMKLVKTSNSYRLIQNPVQEVSQIKGETLFSATNQTYNNQNALQGVKSNSFELNAEIDVNNSSNFTLSFCLGDGDASTLSYNKSTGEITFNRTQSKYGFAALKDKGVYSFKVDNSTNTNGIMKLRLFVDVSNIELYVNDGYYYFIARIQPFSSSQNMSLKGDKLVVKSLTVNKCKPLFVKEDVSAIHIGDSSTAFALIGGADIVRDVYVLGDSEPILTVADPSKVSATLQNGKLTIKALSSGVTYVRISAGKYYKDIEVLAYNQGESYFNNQIGNLTITGGTINISPLDMQIVSNGGDAVAFSNVVAKNLEFSADIRLENNGAGALLIRADGSSDNFYSINIDKNANIVKFWKKVDGAIKDIAVKGITLNESEFNNLKVVAMGANIKVYFNNQLVIDVVDYSLTEGKLGLNVFQTSARFNNIKYTILNAQEGSVDALGTLTKTDVSIGVDNGVIDFNNKSNGGDSYALGSVNGGNFTLIGDIAVGGKGAGAFILRAQDLNNFYCITLDTNVNEVKLWKKVNGEAIVISQLYTTLIKGEFYKVKAELNGASIKIYINGNLVLQGLDSQFASGKIGLNSWLCDCYFKNITIQHANAGYLYFGEVQTQNASLTENAGSFSLDNQNGGDAFAIGSASCNNFTISGDITLSGVGAGSFILRYQDQNNFYCVNIDSEYGVVKVWKKANGTSTIIAQHATTINANTSYNLKVTLNGDNITVFLNNNQVISCQDNSISSGKIGLNSWQTDVVVSNIKCYA